MMKDIPGFEGLYAITTNGQVWSYPKARQKSGRWLKPGMTKNGYLYVNLVTKPYKYQSKFIHRLVLETFVGPGDGCDADHRDFDRQNNHLSNLSWKDHVGNVQRSWTENNTLTRQGENNGRSFLTEAEVTQVRRYRSSGLSLRQITKLTGLKKGHVADICSRRLWSHI